MSHPYDPDCDDCRPALVNPATGKVLPRDDPVMAVVNKVWDEAPLGERRAFIEVTANNSRDPLDMGLAAHIVERIKGVLPDQYQR